MRNVNVGDVVFCAFPSLDGAAISKHFCLVIEVLAGGVFRVAYGSSKKVCESSPTATEVVLVDQDDLAKAGLFKPTRFDLSRKAKVSEGRVVGCLPTHKYRSLYNAALAAGEIKL